MIRAVAKLVFGAFVFLFVASFLAMPCLQSAGGLFVSAGNAPRTASARALRSMPLQGPVSMAVLGTSLLSTPMPGTAPAFSAQYASAWRTSPSPASVPAASAVGTRFPPSPAAAACAEHKLFKPRINAFQAFETPAIEQPLRFALILSIVFGLPLAAAVSARRPVRARPGWIRLRSLPFASSDPPRLAYFAAQRDA